MSSTMGSKKSSKSLPKLKVPSRKQYASSNDQSKVRKLEKRVPKVKLNLVDNICSKLRKDGSWCTGLFSFSWVYDFAAPESELNNMMLCRFKQNSKVKMTA